MHLFFEGVKVFICTSFHFTELVLIRRNLYVSLAGDCYVCSSSFLLSGTEFAARTLQLSADENRATYDLIYMIMLCS